MTETDVGMLWIARVPFVLPRVRIFRRSIVRGVMADGWYASSGVAGQADAEVYACRATYTNWRIEVEWKARVGVMRKSQVAFASMCKDYGNPYLVLRVGKDEAPNDTVERWVEELRGALG
jgi:hypothetical protein